MKSLKRRECQCAIGSGSQYALGALYAGVSPTKEIKTTSCVDPYTNSMIDCVSFGKGDENEN